MGLISRVSSRTYREKMDAQLQMAVQMLKNMDGDGIKRLLDEQLALYTSKKTSSSTLPLPKPSLKRSAPTESTPRLSPNSLKKSSEKIKLQSIDLNKPKIIKPTS